MQNSEPVSLNALAKILGRSKSGLHYLERMGHIRRNSLGKFDIAEVQRAIAQNVDQSMAHRRGAVRKQAAQRCAERSNVRRSNGDGMVRVDGKWLTIEQAQAERDRCLRLATEYRAKETSNG